MNFDAAFERLIGHEGGYVNHPADPGGETNFGISKRAYPGEDIKGMTLDRAKAIYRRDYWDAAACESLPDAVRFDVFDTAVNSGPSRAIILLQKAVGAKPDGALGPKTRAAMVGLEPSQLLARFNGRRIRFITSMPDKWWHAFGRGLMNRIAANLGAA